MIIDFQIHYSPPELVRPKMSPDGRYYTFIRPDGTYDRYQPPLQDTLERHLQVMDEAGVDVAVLSSMAGLSEDLRTCRLVNDRLKEAEERYPGRIKGMAHTYPLGGLEALAELERCSRELGFKGAAMYNIVGERELDDHSLWPFYEKVCDLGLFLFIHPYIKPGYAEFPDYDLSRSAYRECLLQCSLVRLINGGVLDDFPQLKIVYSHLGGGIVANLARVLCYQDKDFWGTAGHLRAAKKCKRDFGEYLSMMYFDTGGVIADLDAVRMALMKLSPRSVVFGTDYPYEIRESVIVRDFIRGIRELPLSKQEIDGILGENGRPLVGLGDWGLRTED